MNNTVDPILAIAILVNIVKPAVLARLRAGGSDSLIRAVALATGITMQVAYAALTATITRGNLPSIVGTGFGQGVWAILLYHLVAIKIGDPEASLENHAGAPQLTTVTPTPLSV